MSIETREITIKGGRDDGKTFVVSQMPLMRGDKWANRVKLALLRSGIDVSALGLDDVLKAGKFTGLANVPRFINMALKALGGLQDEEAESLLEELIKGSKVQIKIANGDLRDILLPAKDGGACDIQDANTLWAIRMECIKVNTDFLKAGTPLA